MKVLVITNLFGFPWDSTRGVFNQQQFDRLAQRVDLEVLVAVPWTEAIRQPAAYWSARREGRKRWPYVDYFIFWYIPRRAQALHSVFFFLSLVLQRPLTVFFRRWQVIVGSWGFPDAVAAVLAARIAARPVVMKVHGTDVNDYLDVPGKRWQILAAARRCRAVMTASGALRDTLVQAGVAPERVQAVYNGVDSTLFHPADQAAARVRLGLDATQVILLCVGNLKQSKGCVDLLEAFSTIAAASPRLCLVYVGDGQARPELLLRTQACAVTDRVQFVGRIEHWLIADWFAAADLLCLPSHSEGVPNVVLEAMACGLPVVATRVGGVPEVVPDFAGMLVPPRDTAALAAALQQALEQRWDRQRIAAYAHRFSWETNIDTVMNLLDTAREVTIGLEARQ